MDDLQMLTLAQCAEITGTSIAFWRKAIARRKVPVHRIGRLVRVARRDLEAMLRAGFRGAREEGRR